MCYSIALSVSGGETYVTKGIYSWSCCRNHMTKSCKWLLLILQGFNNHFWWLMKSLAQQQRILLGLLPVLQHHRWKEEVRYSQTKSLAPDLGDFTTPNPALLFSLNTSLSKFALWFVSSGGCHLTCWPPALDNWVCRSGITCKKSCSN